VDWEDGRICGIVPEPGRHYRRTIAPGFVDAHIHIESSMLPPAEFARLAVVHGTVATVSDPHEIANVLGEAGVAYMIAEAKRTPFTFCFGAPPCVPATPFETSGAALGVRAVARLLARPQIGYLSEFMNFPAVLRGDADALAKIAAAVRLGKPVDGHAPGLRGAMAASYAAAGISTDHECFTLAEARDKIAAGMKILIREGSAARNFAALQPLLRSHPDKCMFCCDDKHPDELIRYHIDEHVRRALASGADRIDALSVASLNPIRHYGLRVGLLQVGDPADFIVFEGWRRLRVRRTYLRGVLAARDGRSMLPRRVPRVINRFRALRRAPADFRTPARRGKLEVIGAIDGQLITRRLRMNAHVVAGAAVADPSRDLLKIAVVNRYALRAPVSTAFIHGFGLRAGAIASSVAHDSHNIVAIGADDASLSEAVNWVIRNRGGVAAVGGTEAGGTCVLPLPIAGLMSDLPGAKVAAAYAEADRFAKALGSKLSAPFMTLSFMALLVIPDLKLSDRGLFSAARGKLLNT